MSQTHDPTAFERQLRSQPEELDRVLASATVRQSVHEAAEGLHRARRIWVVGTGSSQHAAALGAGMIQEAGRTAHAVSAMQFVGWAPIVTPNDALILITHSGETAYAMAARALAFNAGLAIVTITAQGSRFPDAIETVPREPSEVATVGYTSAVLVLAMLASQLGADSITSDALALVPGSVRNAIGSPGFEPFRPPERAVVVAGVGPAAITAREGALKLREAAKLLGEGFDGEYLLHGSAAPLDARDAFVAVGPPEQDGFMGALVKAAQGAGLPTLSILEPAPLPPVLAQIPLTARLQVLALRLAAARGVAPDPVISGTWRDESLWRIGLPGSG
jgi:glucosamine--fructose-6-phosphate aminotransferase (isomerizing)